jgi:nicotinamidase-related amidase
MKALLIIDVQNDYFHGGAMELVGPEKAADNAGSALRAFREARLPVIHIQHVNIREGATFFLPGTQGVEIHASVQPVTGEPVLVKHVPNSFTDTGLAELLEKLGVTELVVCGMMTQMCVDTTVRSAKDHAIAVTLLHDACATRDLSFGGMTVPAAQVQAAFMAALSGMFAQISGTAEAISGLA